MPNTESIATLVHQWYRLRVEAYRKSFEEVMREYRSLEDGIGAHEAVSAQEALTQLRIAVILWQEEAFSHNTSDFFQHRRNAMHAMFQSAIGFLKQKADAEQL